jgi:hypothetical protein
LVVDYYTRQVGDTAFRKLAGRRLADGSSPISTTQRLVESTLAELYQQTSCDGSAEGPSLYIYTLKNILVLERKAHCFVH